MKLADILFEKGRKLGFTDMEVYYQKSKSFNIKVFESEIQNYALSVQEGLSFRGLFDKKMGYAYTEKVDESSVDMLVNAAKMNAEVIESDDEEFIFEGSKEYKTVENYNDSLEKITADDKIDLVFSLEKETKALDERVEVVDPCVYSESFSESIVVNTKGLELRDKSNLAFLYTGVKVREEEDIKTALGYKITNDFSEFNIKEIAKEAVGDAVKMLGAKPIASGDYEIVLENVVAADLLDSFTSIFSAEAVQKDLSRLKGKLEKRVSSELITVVDDPFRENAVGSTGFDSEGVATRYKKLIDKGILKTFLHSLKTAKKDGVEPTGNGFKGYKSSVSIAPTNFYILPGEKSFCELISNIKKGFLVTDLQGLHSGLSAISGDFSLSAEGFLIEEGSLSHPVNQVTIAGNFFDMLEDVEELGSDLRFTLPGAVGSPSLKIKKLSVAGE